MNRNESWLYWISALIEKYIGKMKASDDTDDEAGRRFYPFSLNH